MKLLGFDSVCIWSADYKQLATFYRDVLGLEVDKHIDQSGEQGYQFRVGPSSYFFVGHHDQVSGVAKDPFRMMPGFQVDSVQAVYEQLKAKQVKIVAKPHAVPDGSAYVVTIADPEGNIVQFFSVKP